METLIRAVTAAKDGRNYTIRDEKWHVRFEQLKAFKEMVRIYHIRTCVSPVFVLNYDTQISHDIYFVDAFYWKHGHSNVPTVR